MISHAVLGVERALGCHLLVMAYSAPCGYHEVRYAAHATRRFRLPTNALKKAEFYKTNGH